MLDVGLFMAGGLGIDRMQIGVLAGGGGFLRRAGVL